MGEIEFDGVLLEDYPVKAKLPAVSHVKPQRPRGVVAVGNSDKGQINLVFQDVDFVAPMHEIDVAEPSAIGSDDIENLQIGRLGFKKLAGAVLGELEGFFVGDQLVARTDHADGRIHVPINYDLVGAEMYRTSRSISVLERTHFHWKEHFGKICVSHRVLCWVAELVLLIKNAPRRILPFFDFLCGYGTAFSQLDLKNFCVGIRIRQSDGFGNSRDLPRSNDNRSSIRDWNF